MRQSADDGDLQLVGILELIDHDDPEALAVARRELGVLGEGVQAPTQQISLIEPAAPLRPGISVLHQARERHGGGSNPRPQGRPGLGEHIRIGLAPGGECLGIRLLGAVLLRRGRKAQKYVQVQLRIEARTQKALARIGRKPSLGPLDALLQSCGERLVGGGGLVPFPHRALDFPGRFQNQPHKLLRRGGRLRHPQAAEPLGHCPHPGHHFLGVFKKPLVERAAALEPELVHNRAQQRIGALLEVGEHLLYGLGPKVARLRLVDHLERGIDAHLEGVLAQDAGGHGADGAHPGVVHLQRLLDQAFLAQKPADAVAQLGGRLHREGDGEHLVDRSQAAGFPLAGEQPVGDAARQGERLPRAGAGGHHEGSIESGDGQALALFAAIEIHASLPEQS